MDEPGDPRSTILVFGPGPEPSDIVHLPDSEPVTVRVGLRDDGGANSLSVSIHGSTDDVHWIPLVDCGAIAEGEEAACEVDAPMPSLRAWLQPNAPAGWSDLMVCAVSLPRREVPEQEQRRLQEAAEFPGRFREERGVLDLLPRGLSSRFPGP